MLNKKKDIISNGISFVKKNMNDRNLNPSLMSKIIIIIRLRLVPKNWGSWKKFQDEIFR